MIGQMKNKKHIQKLIDDFPRFVLLVGPEGSGKKLLAKHIGDKLRATFIKCSIDVKSVRNIRALAYKQKGILVYCFADIQDMSTAAKNAMLKVIEETPNRAYFVMTTTSNTLRTIKSRAYTINMEPYSEKDLEEYIETIRPSDEISGEEVEQILQIATVPADVEKLIAYDILTFNSYINKVINKIHVVSGANAFKIADKLQIKKDGEGWDIQLFLKAVLNFYNEQMKTERLKVYHDCIRVTNEYLQDLHIKGINRAFLIDGWIMDIRTVWRHNVTNT